MIDSHAHIYLEQFDQDRGEMIERAKSVGISKIFMPNIDSGSIDRMLKTEDEFPEFCIPMMGLHPCSINKDFEKELKIVEDNLSKRKWSAIGEIGIDLYWDKSTLDIQIEALKIQIEWAKKYKLPIVIHCREAFKEIFETLDQIGTENLSGVFHCFTGGERELNRVKEFDFYIGIGGVLTYKNQSLTDIAEKMNHKRILLETDSPYLAPVPKRGKRNEPSYMQFINEKFSEVLNISSKDLDDITTENSLEFFQHQNV